MSDDKIMKSIEERLAKLENIFINGPRTGGPITDPPPWGGSIPQWHFPHQPFPFPFPPTNPFPYPFPFPFPVDPSPWGGGYKTPQANAPWLNLGGLTFRPPINPVADPPPFDLSSLNIAQLESSLHTLKAEQARLTSLEKLVNVQIEKLKTQK